jgi:hypothetical protein
MKIYMNGKYDGVASLMASVDGELTLMTFDESVVHTSLGTSFNRLPLGELKLEILPDFEERKI